MLSQDAVNIAQDKYDLELVACIRDQDVDIKDPVPGKGIQETGLEVNEAALACMNELGNPPVDGPPASAEDSLRLRRGLWFLLKVSA